MITATIHRGQPVAPRSRTRLYSVTTSALELVGGDLLLPEAEALAGYVNSGNLCKLHKLPRASVTPLSWKGRVTSSDSPWVTDGTSILLETAVRDHPVSRSLLAAMKRQQVIMAACPTDAAIAGMVSSEGAKATAKAKVAGALFNHHGVTAYVDPVDVDPVAGAFRVSLDSRKLSLMGAVCNGALYVRPGDPYAPVAFKQGSTTVGLIMPIVPSPSGEEEMYGQRMMLQALTGSAP